LCIVFATTAGAQYRFLKIVDSTTTIPAGVGAFTSFSDVAFDGQNVAILGSGAGGQKGVYLWNGTALANVAHIGATVPNGGGTFTQFSRFSIDNGNVAFVSEGTAKDGVYTTLGGSLRKVADEGTLVPGTSVPFTQFTFSTDVAIDGESVYFNAFGTNGSVFHEGVYRETNGALARIADRNTPIPDFGQNFIFFSAVDASQRNVIFSGGRGTGGGNGRYTTLGAPAGQIRTALNADTMIPGLTNPLSIFSPNDARIDGTNIAFRARGANSFDGLYLERNGALETVVDQATANPLNGVNFTSIGNIYALSGDNVLFSGSSGGPSGVFLKTAAGVTPIIHSANTLNGKDFTGGGIHGESLVDDRFAFIAGFSDGSSAVYLAEPMDVTPGPQSSTFAPIFDASSNGANVSDGAFRIDVQNRLSTATDRRAILEFDLSTLPAGAMLQTAELRIEPSLLTSTTTEGSLMAVYGYAGDGVLTDADRLRTDVFLGETPMLFDLDPLQFHLDVAGVQLAMQSGSILGLVGMGGFNGNQFGFDSKELEGLGSSQAARLILTYTAPLAGDFNADGSVDAADYVVWRKGLGTTHTALQYGIWRANFGKTTASAAVATGNVPEPPTIASMLIVLLMTVSSRRSLVS
jgi:hypothetical protein